MSDLSNREFVQPAQSHNVEMLTSREMQVLELLGRGYFYREIAQDLGVGYDTVHSHLRKIYKKLQVRSRTEAVVKFLGSKMILPSSIHDSSADNPEQNRERAIMKTNLNKSISTFFAVALLLAGLVSAHATATVAFVNSTSTSVTTGTTTPTVSSFTMGSGANCLVVMLSGKANTGVTVNSVSFGGTTVTPTGSIIQLGPTGGAQITYIAWLINPTITSGNVVVTTSLNFTGEITVMALSGVGQTTAGGSVSTQNATGTAVTLTYTGTTGGAMAVAASDSKSSGTPTITGSPTPTSLFRGNPASSEVGQSYALISSGSSSLTATYTPSGTSTRLCAAVAALDPGQFTVTYDANGGSAPPTDNNFWYMSGGTVTVRGQGSMTKTSYTFAHWNTASDGSGTSYNANDTFAISGNTTLYAIWTAAVATITPSASTFPSALTTIYGTASGAQSVTVSGSGLTADITATVSTTGLEISTDNSTWGTTKTFTQSGGNASGTLYIRLAATAPVSGTYNSQNVVLSTTGAQSVNVATTSTLNAVTAKTLTVDSPTVQNKSFDGTTTATVGGSLNGVVNGDSPTLGGTFAQSAPGNNLAVTFAVIGTGAGNYSLTQPSPGLTANITGTSITLTTDDASGTSSFNAAGHWSVPAAPTAGNTYYNGDVGRVLRTPTTSSSFTFAGDSLTISNGSSGSGQLAIKNGGTGVTNTIANLILKGGQVSETAGGNSTLAGGIMLSNACTFSTFATVTVTAPIGGDGSLAKANPGTLVLSAANTYTGATAVNAGTLRVDGSIANSPVTVASGATLGGNGTVNGAVTVNGTMSPGASIGTLTLGASPTLNGTLLMEINTTNSPATNDMLVVVGNSLTFGGTLTVTNTGNSLAGGESFTLFTAGGFGGVFSSTNLSSLGSGLNWWLGELLSNGKIIVNRAPSASDKNYTRGPGASLRITKSDLLVGASDADSGDSVNYDALVSSGSHGTITETDSYILYEANDNSGDTLQFRLKDTRGGTVVKNINITVDASGGGGIAQNIAPAAGGIAVTFAGIPTFKYDVQRADDVDFTSNLTTLATTNAPGNGIFTILDNAPSQPTGFYRLKFNPN